MELGTLKYTDLRRLAKEVGIKANLKADKLLKALEQHYEQQDGGLLKSARKEVTQDSAPVHGQAAQKQANFVTERRSRVTLKRKHEDLEMKLSPRPVNQVERPSVEPEEKRSSKRKKTSLEKEAVAPVVSEKENKPEKQTEPTSNKIDPDTSVKAEEKTSQRPPGKIPRAAELMSKAKAAKRPVTPNFKKLHEAHFNKMESIDAYVQRKNKTIDSFRNTVNELKKLKVNGSALFSPAALAKKPGPDKGRVTQLSANKPALKGSAIFKPTVVSTAKINVRFSQGTQDNEHKRSLIKTPARMSPHVQLTSTPARKSSTTQQKTGANTSVLSTSKTPGTTPFVFKANTSMTTTPHGTKRNAFDLKASLSKPLTYKPHTGKLKPFAETQDNTLNKSQTVPSHQKNYKQHKVQTRNDRRVKHTEDRKQKKEKMIGARRGLVMT
ncbi:nucleolar and spindle-associated protein 1-like isoform X5 [Engraulis encrasicolus]|uniref:nucleolar and spindle-associated protein 1-like isoform X5 n=1 Tax=Engraulis encrasicolus TaxID=184585 RepID=UPI002FD640BA